MPSPTARLSPILVLFAVLACAPSASAQTRRLDLAGAAVMERPAAAGTPITLILENLIPRMRYEVTVRQEVIPVPPLSRLTAREAAIAQPCDSAAAKLAKQLNEAESEADVSGIISRITDGEACSEDLRELAREATTRTLDEPVILRPGQRLVVEVRRNGEPEDAEWRFVFATEARGEWRTSYGFTFVPQIYPQYFTEQVEGDPEKFVIVKESGRKRSDLLSNYDFLPSLMFTYLPTAARYRNWSGGFTAGLGYDLSKVAVLGGVSLTYNENVTLVGGLAIHQQPRLVRQYHPGDIVDDPIDSKVLHEQRFGPNVFFGISFRLGSNPFSRDEETEEEDEAAEGEGETRPGSGTEAPPKEEAPAGTRQTPQAGEFDPKTVAAGDTLVPFVIRRVESVAGGGTIDVDVIEDTVHVTGAYTLQGTTPCLKVADAGLAFATGSPLEVLCLSGPTTLLEQVKSRKEGDPLTVAISGYRVQWTEADDKAVYDQAAVTHIIPEGGGDEGDEEDETEAENGG